LKKAAPKTFGETAVSQPFLSVSGCKSSYDVTKMNRALIFQTSLRLGSTLFRILADTLTPEVIFQKPLEKPLLVKHF
jgi:hypothetical protein